MVALTLAMLAGLPAGAATADSPERRRPELDRIVTAFLDRTNVPGAAVVVTRGDRVVHLRGYGRTSTGQPVTPSTPFRIASLSKSFTAVAVLQLVEAGRIELDRPFTAYLPAFDPRDERLSQVSARQLLHQTDGLADRGYPEATLPVPDTLAERVRSLQQARLVSAPGSAFHYFNPNYDLLAHIVARVSGRSFTDYLRAEVLRPIGMTATTLVDGSPWLPAPDRLADGHVLVFGQPVARPELDGFLGGHGAMVSTARDMGRWLRLQSGGGRHDGRRVLSRASVAATHRPPKDVDSAYAMGWVVERGPDGGRRLVHNGVLSTYYAEQVLLPASGYGIAVLLNAYHAAAPLGVLADQLAAALERRPRPEAYPFTAVEAGLAALAAALAVAGGRGVAHASTWARKRERTPVWWLPVRLAWPLVPVPILVLLPQLVAWSAGRVFSRVQLWWALPSVHVLLGVAAAAGLAVAVVRLTQLMSRTPAPRPLR